MSPTPQDDSSPLERDIESHLALGGRPADARQLLERASEELRGLRQTVDLQKRLLATVEISDEAQERISAEWLQGQLGALAEPPAPTLRIVSPPAAPRGE